MHIDFDGYTFEGSAWYGDGCAHKLVSNTGVGICIGEHLNGALNAVPNVSEQEVATYLINEPESIIEGFIEANGDYDDTEVFVLMSWNKFLSSLSEYKAKMM